MGAALARVPVPPVKVQKASKPKKDPAPKKAPKKKAGEGTKKRKQREPNSDDSLPKKKKAKTK